MGIVTHIKSRAEVYEIPCLDRNKRKTWVKHTVILISEFISTEKINEPNIIVSSDII